MADRIEHRHQPQDQGTPVTDGHTASIDRMLQHLKEAEEHVQGGDELLRRQRALIDELDRDGHDTSTAREVLRTLERSQSMHIADRDRILDEVERLR